MNLYPFVSRRAFELVVQRAEAAERAADQIRTDAVRQIDFAFQQQIKAVEQARLLAADARAVMAQAIDLSKLASRQMFGDVNDTPGPVSSIAENDRAVAQARASSRR